MRHHYVRMSAPFALLGGSIALFGWLAACGTEVEGCTKDTDCKADRICDAATLRCIDPTSSTPREGLSCSGAGRLVCGESADQKVTNAVLYCDSDQYQSVFVCPSTDPCKTYRGETSIQCGPDTGYVSYAKTDAVCASEGGGACSFDRRLVLVCTAGKWTPTVHCEPSTCAVKTSTRGGAYVACDNGGVTLGDVCNGLTVACSTDLKSVLECKDSTMQLRKTCGDLACSRAAGVVDCR